MPRESKDLIVGLDIGTSKIVALVAEIKPEGRIEVLGVGMQPSRGLKKGVVVNIEATVDAISRAIQEVELQADCKIAEVITGIAGSHIRSFNSNGMVAIKDKEVSDMDVERVGPPDPIGDRRIGQPTAFEQTPDVRDAQRRRDGGRDAAADDLAVERLE